MNLIERTALRAVPRDWRDDVARDLQEERTAGAGTLWMTARVLGIGMRLRLARSSDSLTSGGSPSGRATRRFPMHDFGRDIRLAIRSTLRQPGYALAIVATLAIGIGANTAIFSVFNWIMFRPLPGVAQPDRLVTVKYQTPQSSGRYFVPYLDYAALRDGVKAFDLASSLPLSVHLANRAAEDGIRVEAEVVTTNYFAVLGATPPRGRGFLPVEERTLEGVPPAVISDSLWRRQYEADPEVLGRTIMIDGDPFVVVGVAPPGFRGRSLVNTSDLWVPVGAHMFVLPHHGSKALTARGNTFFGDSFGRLRAGVSLEQAQIEAHSFAEASPEFATRVNRPKNNIRPVLYAGLGHDTFAAERLTRAFNLLMGAVGLVLLLACANAANLLLARTATRRREIAVRQAIGASRLRIVRQHLAEGLVLALAAGAAGLALAVWLTNLFDGMRILTFLPEIEGVRLDWRVAAFALAASLMTAGLFATAPAIVGSRVDLLASLKDGLTSSRRGRHVLRGGLVTVQITISLVLLVGAVLFVRSLVNIRALDLGVRGGGLSTFLVDPSRLGHDPDRSQRMLKEVATRLAGAPGISSAAVAWSTPYGRLMRADLSFTRPEAPHATYDSQITQVSSGYFATMGIPLLAGRDFTDAEFGKLNTSSGVVILSRALAEKMFPSGGAVGSRLRLSYPEKMEAEVVGVVGDVRGHPITEEPADFAYEPGGQRWAITWGHVVARSDLPTAQVSATARDVMRSVDPAFTPPLVESFETLIGRTLAEQRLFAKLSSLFAAVAALLAGIGIYAMMAGAVAERRREFGIRLALGAVGASVMRLVVRSAVTLGVLGVVTGVAASAVLRRVIESRLFGIGAFDPATLAAAGLGVIVLCVAASLVPAVRAARIDPVRSLRVE